MTDLLALTILTALFTSGVLFVLNKWEVLVWYQLYRKRWMPQGDCYFCLSFWLSLPVLVHSGYLVYSGYWFILPVLVGCSIASATLSAFVCSVIIGTETN